LYQQPEKDMKNIRILLSLSCFLAGALSLSLSAQGWEREYDNFTFRDVLALPNGKFAALGWEKSMLISPTGYPLAVINNSVSAIGTEFSYSPNPCNWVEMPDGSVTGLISKGHFMYFFNMHEDTGELQWDTLTTLAHTENSYFQAEKILLAPDEGFFIMSNFRIGGEKRPALHRLDADLNLLWTQTFHPDLYALNSYATAKDMAFNAQGQLVMLVGDTSPEIFFLRISQDGDLLDARTINPQSIDDWLIPNRFVIIPGGDYLVAGEQYFVNDYPSAISRIQPDGEVQWTSVLPAEVRHAIDLVYRPDGTIFVQGMSNDPQPSLLLSSLQEDGAHLWTRDYPYPFIQRGFAIDLTNDGGLIIAGDIQYPLEFGGTSIRGYLLRLGSQGQLYNSQVEGVIFEDLDGDCAPLPEAPLGGWLVAFMGQDTFYALTDSMGHYERRLNPDTYATRVYPPSAYWGACPSPQSLAVADFDTVTRHFPVQVLIECPSLQVDISAPFLRRCFESRYTVYYCNTGTIAQEDAYVEVELDDFLTFIDAGLPVATQDGTFYTFELGTVEPGECGQFFIDVEVSCDALLGQTHCTAARIFPEAFCDESSGWSGASVAAEGVCAGDSVRFTLRNVGTAPTFDGLQYIVIEDQVILREGFFSLLPGEEEEISLAATGATLRLEAEQEPNHPGNDMPTVTVEGCGQPGQPISLGYTTQYWENDGDPTISIDCQENIGSYDPNDKRAYPKGYANEHLIEANQPLEYHIRFQNTGTDTAFTVVIEDRLDDHLDITTVVPGASSHPYTYDITRDRRMTFTFNDILLPDSTTNEPASHGFVKFKVRQLPDLPVGTRIENQAAIYFDFNAPIFTNTTFHTIGEDYIPSVFVPDVPTASLLSVYPNPFVETTTLQLCEYDGETPVRLELFDTNGRLVRVDQYQESRPQFRRQGLPKGIYFFRISGEQLQTATGKLVIQ
jgi:uncharacterized repeat protein (TIGR01451 family)